MNSSRFTACAVFLALSTGIAPAGAAALSHLYTLNGTYADSLGGPSLVPAGGTLDPVSGYTFPANQGVAVSNAFANPADYSIVLDFRFTNVNGYRRIVEFKNRSSDVGFYVLNGHLNFYPVVTSATDQFNADTFYRVVLTRDSATNTVTAYLNGTQSLTFADGSGLGVFTGPNEVANLFIDDSVVVNEASAGFVNRIALYDGDLSAAEVAALGGPSLLTGDANRNGRIDADDYALTDRGRARGLAGWGNGDFNGDGVVNATDYALIDASYASAGGLFEPGYTIAVPEPAAVVPALLAVASLVRGGTRVRRLRRA
jgi:hypothetical protein